MKLRLRFFLYVAVLFTFVLLSTFFLQESLIKKNLSLDEKKFLEEFHLISQEKIKRIEKYIFDILKDYQEKINSLLSIIENLPILRYNFIPISAQSQKQTWLDASTLITNNKWIDLAQNIKENQLCSSIVVKNNVLPRIKILSVTDHLHFVQDGAISQDLPMVAVYWKNPDFIQVTGNALNDSRLSEEIADFYIVFDPKTILELDLSTIDFKNLILSIDPMYPFLKWIEVSEKNSLFDGLIEELKFVQNDLKNIPLYPTKKDFNEKFQIDAEEKVELHDSVDRYHQIGMIWGLTTLIASGPFGTDPYDPRAPKGIIRSLKKGANKGEWLRGIEVFPRALSGNISEKSLNVLFIKNNEERSFFTSSIFFNENGKKSELTIGIETNKVLKELALATNRDILFLSGNQLINYYDKDGFAQDIKTLSKDTIQYLLSHSTGNFERDGKSYFFLHINPIKDSDIHFFAITTFDHEFALLNNQNSQIKQAVKRINFEIFWVLVSSIILLMFILDFIAKNIARPISTLAMAATAVKEGHFDDVYNPQGQKIKGDEVSCLYDSFYDMVKGLKEKERVRGILNKVVSADVAEEILKNDLNLGGEDKQISILFADIRGFTELTEHMEPKDVIEILNQVMTLISKPIEAHHGVIDKYVGDEVMALFGAPLDLVDHEYQAVVAALKMRESLDQFNNERKKANKKEVLMGIGVHDGNVLAGNMGAETRLNYTVIGSNVNMAARMCSAAKGGEILVSESIIKNPKVAREIEVRALEPILFKGFSNKVNIYAVVGFKKQN